MQAVVWLEKVMRPKFNTWELCKLNKVNHKNRPKILLFSLLLVLLMKYSLPPGTRKAHLIWNESNTLFENFICK